MKYITITIPASIAEQTTSALVSVETQFLQYAYKSRKDDGITTANIFRDLAQTISNGRNELDAAIWDADTTGTTTTLRVFLNAIRKIDDALTEAAKYTRAIANGLRELAASHPDSERFAQDSMIASSNAETVALISNTLLDAIADGLVANNVNPLTLQVA